MKIPKFDLLGRVSKVGLLVADVVLLLWLLLPATHLCYILYCWMTSKQSDSLGIHVTGGNWLILPGILLGMSGLYWLRVESILASSPKLARRALLSVLLLQASALIVTNAPARYGPIDVVLQLSVVVLLAWLLLQARKAAVAQQKPMSADEDDDKDSEEPTGDGDDADMGVKPPPVAPASSNGAPPVHGDAGDTFHLPDWFSQRPDDTDDSSS